jgi:hypothetical protein
LQHDRQKVASACLSSSMERRPHRPSVKAADKEIHETTLCTSRQSKDKSDLIEVEYVHDEDYPNFAIAKKKRTPQLPNHANMMSRTRPTKTSLFAMKSIDA